MTCPPPRPTGAPTSTSSASYPTWSKPVIVPKSTSFAYTYVKEDGSGNVTWGVRGEPHLHDGRFVRLHDE
ncbi:carbohydrate-binding module family 20 domain-containing protein [Streptomyces sp. NPDC001135]